MQGHQQPCPCIAIGEFMKKHKKFKDEFSKRDSKQFEKKTVNHKKGKLRPSDNRPPKYRLNYLNEEE